MTTAPQPLVTSLTVEGHRVRVFPARPAGSASGRPPVLLLNGACLVSGGWRRVRHLLADHDVITVDRPGYHGTPLGPLPSLRAEVRALFAVLRAVTTQVPTVTGPVVVVAHSMASFQAEAMARQRPELIAGIVMVDPSIVGRYARPPLAAKSAWQVARAAIGLRVGQDVGRWLVRQALRTQTRHRTGQEWRGSWESAEALAAGAGEWLSYRSQARELWHLRRRTSWPHPATIMLEAPPYAWQVPWPGCEVRRVAGSGHLMMIDDPGAIAQAVRDLSLAQAPRRPGTASDET